MDMNKRILLISICAVIVFSTAVLVVVYASGNHVDAEKGGVKETALKIGRALLEEHFPDTFLDTEISLEAEEKNGIWKVHNVVEREGKAKDGKITFVKGGEVYVEFRKSNGEVIKFGLDD
jgi:sensor histidine kinase regulating citrate/malate metabolism